MVKCLEGSSEEGRRKKEEVGGKSEGSRIELFRREEIGRASCRERVSRSV